MIYKNAFHFIAMHLLKLAWVSVKQCKQKYKYLINKKATGHFII